MEAPLSGAPPEDGMGRRGERPPPPAPPRPQEGARLQVTSGNLLGVRCVACHLHFSLRQCKWFLKV